MQCGALWSFVADYVAAEVTYMKRIILTLFISLLLCMSAAFPAAAAGDSGYGRLADEAALLYDHEAEDISAKLDGISKAHNFDVAIVTVNSLDGKSATEFADDYYDENGYGSDGIMLLLTMDDRDWAITTRGFGITAFTDAGQSYIMDNVLDSLGEGKYYTAFYDFAYYCDDLLTQAENGTPYDVKSNENESSEKKNPVIWIPVSVILGALISLLLKKQKKKSLKNVKFKKDAADYTAAGSLTVTGRTDTFLSRTVDRRAKPKDGGSGGSSTYTSSSGATHGGSSGKF